MAEMLLLSAPTHGCDLFSFPRPFTSFEGAFLGPFRLFPAPVHRRHHTITHYSRTKEEPSTLREGHACFYTLPCNSLNECWRSKLAAAIGSDALLGALCRKKVSAAACKRAGNPRARSMTMRRALAMANLMPARSAQICKTVCDER